MADYKTNERYLPRTGNLIASDNQLVNEADYIRRKLEGDTLFNETISVQRSSVFSLSSIYPLSVFRDVVSGTVVHDVDEYILSPGATLDTAQQGLYIPGFEVNAGIGVRADADADLQYGYYDDNNGFFFKFTQANGPQLGIRRAGVDILIDRADFNVDKLDGTGPSGINVDRTLGYVWEIDFTWYGYGPIIWKVVDKGTGESKKPRTYIIHITSIPADTSTQNPNLSIRAENLGASGNVYVTGRQFSIYGPYTPASRLTGITSNIVTVSDTWTYIMGFTRVSEDFYRIRTDSARVINKGVNDIEVQLIVNPVITGFTPVSPPNRSPSETAVNFDISGTGFTGGEVFFSSILEGSSRTDSNASIAGEIDREVPRTYPVAMVARCLNAGQTSDVLAHLRVREEW